MFTELYNNVKTRFGDGSASQAMGDWICSNTTIKKRPFSFEGYEFQHAIADDMHPDMTVIKCSQVGLALAVDTPLPTPYGWTTMGQVQVGDELYDESGQPCLVTYKSPVYEDHQCYRITFDDGESIVADAGHRWHVEADRAFDLSGEYTGRGRPPLNAEMFKSGVLTTEVIHKFHKHGARNRFAVPNTETLQGSSVQLPVDPYLLGLWLGDGNTYACVLTTHEKDLSFYVEELNRRGLKCIESSRTGNSVQIKVHRHDQKPRGRGEPNSVAWDLTKLGLLSYQKSIPLMYLRAPEQDRRDLLCGLLDTDGSVTANGRVSFHNTNQNLVDGVNELARSLGYKTRTLWRMTPPSSLKTGRTITPRLPIAEVSWVSYADEPVFLLPRKRERLSQRADGRPLEALRRRITKVEPVPQVEVQCLTVDSSNHLFLAGKAMVPTHNTEVQIRKFLGMLTRGNSLSGIFSLPTEKMFTRMYNGRIKPILDQDEIFNPEVESNPVRRRDQIQIRDSFGYVTGCTEGDATSTSADFLMHDEVDLSPQEVLSLYQSRLQNSDMQITQKFSTPTYMGFGIDKSYGMTDRHEYLARCEACNHWQIPLFTPEFIKLKNYPFELQDFTKLTGSQIGQLDLEDAHVVCEQCQRRLNLADPSLREWVPMFPSRNNFRGYWVRPFSTSRLKPRYIFTQLAKYQEDGFIRGFHNTVLGQPYSDKDAQMQRGDIESCMQGGGIPDVGDKAVFLGVDIGFQCHITLSIDAPDGVPTFIFFEAVPIGGLESRISDLRKVYNIVQGASDRFPYTSEVDALRDVTGQCVMPVQYRGNAALAPVKDELGFVTHYSANRTYMLDRIHTFVNHRKMVLTGYGNQKETLVTHLSDMHRDDRPDAEAVWVKNSGNDHYFHSMALSLVSRRICEFMLHRQDTPPPITADFLGADLNSGGSNLIQGSSKRLSRLGMRS